MRRGGSGISMILARVAVSAHLYLESFKARWGASITNTAAEWGRCSVYITRQASYQAQLEQHQHTTGLAFRNVTR